MLPVYFGTTVLLVNGLNKGKHQIHVLQGMIYCKIQISLFEHD